MSVSEKLAYLKGLTAGFDIKEGSKESKLISAVIDTLDAISLELKGLNENALDLGEEIDQLSEDLAAVEEIVYDEDDDDDCCCCEDNEDDDCCCGHHHDDDEEPLFFEVTCPSCDNTITVDEDVLNLGTIQCPNCGEMLEFDFDDDDGEDEDSAPEDKED